MDKLDEVSSSYTIRKHYRINIFNFFFPRSIPLIHFLMKNSMLFQSIYIFFNSV